MSDYESKIDELMYEAFSLPNGPTKVSLMEEAVRLADLHNDHELSYETRSQLMEAAIFSGRIDLLMVAFAWCLAAFDKDPDNFDEHDLLWKYKWVIHQTLEFPAITREKMEEMLADMERRSLAGGYSLHAVTQQRRDLLIDMHDVEGAKAAQAAHKKTKVDYLSDCPACTRANDGDYYALLKQWKQQLKTLEPVLAGKLICAEQPISSASKAMITLLRLGQRDEAQALQQKYVKKLKLGNDHNRIASNHITFLSLTGEPAKAKRIFEKFLPEILDSVSRADRLHLFRAGVVMLDRLGQKSKLVKLTPHPELPAPNEKGQYEVAALRDWMYNDALKISRVYDARNGNDGEERKTQELPELIEELSAA
jgi:hypothetical protein